MSIRLGVVIQDGDIEWAEEKDAPYRYHIKLTHKPTEMIIEQASDSSFVEAKTLCLKELQWRLKNWKEYCKSLVRGDD